jgi:hypothetical protein
LERKFYYAGGSARFMFDYTSTQLVRTVLPDLFDEMSESSLWTEYSYLKIHSGSETINSLIQSRGDNVYDATPVSKYVLFQAYNHCKNDLVRSMTAAAAELSGDPVLQGWAFELEPINWWNVRHLKISRLRMHRVLWYFPTIRLGMHPPDFQQ